MARVGIRRFQEADLDVVIGIAESLAEAPHWPRQAYVDLLNVQASPQRIAMVASDHQTAEVWGFAVASLVAPQAELETIAVTPAAQRRGVGRQLLAGLVEQLRRLGIEELWLEVRSSNLTAISFYRAANFKQTGIRHRYYTDPEEDAVLMSLDLD
jgi:ribosomal-protein-alanine N-acetyltransferase